MSTSLYLYRENAKKWKKDQREIVDGQQGYIPLLISWQNKEESLLTKSSGSRIGGLAGM